MHGVNLEMRNDEKSVVSEARKESWEMSKGMYNVSEASLDLQGVTLSEESLEKLDEKWNVILSEASFVAMKEENPMILSEARLVGMNEENPAMLSDANQELNDENLAIMSVTSEDLSVANQGLKEKPEPLSEAS